MKVLIDKPSEYLAIYRCSRTGIAWVENGSTGSAHSPHPNICSTGSVRGMKSLGYWNKTDKVVRTHGAIYNISRCCTTDELDKLAMQHCQCGGKHS
jgi:hypothetical protein